MQIESRKKGKLKSVDDLFSPEELNIHGQNDSESTDEPQGYEYNEEEADALIDQLFSEAVEENEPDDEEEIVEDVPLESFSIEDDSEEDENEDDDEYDSSDDEHDSFETVEEISPEDDTEENASSSEPHEETELKKNDAPQYETEDVEVPMWVMSLRSKLMSSVSHAFMLEGNIRDYMVRSIPIQDGIILTLDPVQTVFSTIAFYDQAHGISFYANGQNVSEAQYNKNFLKLIEQAGKRLNIPVDGIPNDPVMLFTLIAEVFDCASSDSYEANMLLFVDYPELLIPDANSSQMRPEERKLSIILSELCRSSKADETGSCLVFTADDATQVSSKIRNTSARLDRITVPSPLSDERADFIDNVLDVPENKLSNGTQIFQAVGGVSKEYLTSNTAGLARYQIEDIVLRALSDDTPITETLVKERKNDIIKADYDDVIEIMEPTSGFKGIGGMQQIKDFFTNEIVKPIHRNELEAVPMGVLLSGAPGTGKTVLAKAVAYESGMNCVNLNLNRIFDKYVGSSERNLDRALECAMSMQPTIIFIDEIDEALPSRSNPDQSGVSKRINKRLLEFFSDTSHRGKVIILAATNYPEKIDEAFKRAGRFDKRIPMFAPDRFDRMRVLKIVAERKGYSFSWFDSPDKLIKNPFQGLSDWLKSGNIPHNEGFVGNQSEFRCHSVDDFGRDQSFTIMLPDAIINIVNAKKIMLSQFYRCSEILLETVLEERYTDASSTKVESDEDYYNRIDNTIAGQTAIFGTSESNLASVARRLKLYSKIYKPFFDKTNMMTGAELEVVISKCIVLFREWKEAHREVFEKAIADGVLKDERDIPWNILYEACRKTACATGNIKKMEDNALIDTSDLDFIPDACYGITDEGKEISYLERQSELRTKLQGVRD